MGHLEALPNVDPGKVGEVASVDFAIPSEIPDHLAKLSAAERKVWKHVTAALLEYGMVHRTDGLVLTIICKTFVSWVDAEAKLAEFKAENNGGYMTKTPNGYEQPHQLYYVARNLKRELLQWLPEAALTIPSFHKIVGERMNPQQGSLFEDPVENHRRRRAAIGMTVHQGGAGS